MVTKAGMIASSPPDSRYARLHSPPLSALADLPRYAIASAFSFAFVIASTAALHELVGVSETLSPALALALALLVNFTLLRTWVFPGQTAPVGRQLAETAVTSLLFRALEYGLFLIGHLA